MQSDVMTFWNFTNIIRTSSSLYNFCLFKILWINYCAFHLPLYLLIFNRSKNIHSHLHSLQFYYHSYVHICYFNITHTFTAFHFNIIHVFTAYGSISFSFFQKAACHAPTPMKFEMHFLPHLFHLFQIKIQYFFSTVFKVLYLYSSFNNRSHFTSTQ